MALVNMHAARQDEDASATRRAADQLAGVTNHARGRPVRNLLIPDRRGLAQALGKIAETRAQHDGDRHGQASGRRPR